VRGALFVFGLGAPGVSGVSGVSGILSGVSGVSGGGNSGAPRTGLGGLLCSCSLQPPPIAFDRKSGDKRPSWAI
jgi:hypothetical protein